MLLPSFRYHPDPLATGAIVESEDACDVCGKARGYTYAATFYSEGDEPTLCPWCIADGSAAKKLGGTFSDDSPLHEAELSDAIIAEICERTPGFNALQQEVWQTHCNDACAFHGDATKADLAALKDEALEALLETAGLDEDEWKPFLKNYKPGNNPAVFKFICLKCETPIFYFDQT